MRHLCNLRSAEMLKGWPEMIPKSKPRGIKALGRRYEMAVSRQLGPDAHRGIWWSYRDANGPGLYQTDFLITGVIWAVILECKHTWTLEGMEQLRNYMPVVEMALNKRVLGVQVCKHLVPEHVGPVYNDLADAVNAARYPAQLVTLHWRGVGPLVTTRKEPQYVHV